MDFYYLHCFEGELMKKSILAALAFAMAAALWPETAHAGDGPVFEWQQASWRLELSAMTGIDSGRRDRVGDFNGAIVFDYEMPFASDGSILDRSTFSFRLRPLMYYHQDNYEDDEDIFMAGAGLAYRVYQHKETKSGFFVEGAIELLGQTGKYEGNSGTFNVLDQIGVGYQSEKSWFATLRFQHASNAGLADDNSGVNSVGVAAGFRF